MRGAIHAGGTDQASNECRWHIHHKFIIWLQEVGGGDSELLTEPYALAKAKPCHGNALRPNHTMHRCGSDEPIAALCCHHDTIGTQASGSAASPHVYHVTNSSAKGVLGMNSTMVSSRS